MKILVVDDEKLLVKGIKFNLENEGYSVEACYDGETAVQMAASGEYSLIILDLMLPGLDGLEACQKIRAFSTVPIIMLTARSEDADKLLGFESGADDYITKPFNPLEMIARVKSQLRRYVQLGTAADAGGASEVLSVGGLALDVHQKRLTVDGEAAAGPLDTAYYSPYASGKADGVSYSLNGQEVRFYRYEQGDNLLAAPKGLSGEALYRYFYDHFGAKFVTLENPAFESTGDYNIYKEYSTAISAFYEAGSASDTLAQKLYNYSFRRIQLSAPEGDLTAVTFPLEPQVLGTYALRTLDDAKGALMAGEAWIGGTQGGYDGGAVNILHWEITYYRSRLMDTIQPVYCFLIDSPDGEAPFFDDGDPEGYKSVTYAYVPALLPEQLSENTFVQVFN